MHLFFSNPLFWLLAVALVPLLVHLFARSRPREKDFSSLFLLKQVIQHHIRMRRPKDWLLLLLRTLAVLCLAAAFLLPYFSGSRLEEQGNRSVILVVDRSASMAAADGQESRIGKAGMAAGRILEGLKPGDLVNLVWLDAVPSPLFREPSPSRDMAARELRRIHSHGEAGNPAAALALAVEQAGKTASTRPTSIYIISDFQASNWKKSDWKAMLPRDLAVQCVSVADDPMPPNTAVTALKAMPATVLPGQSVEIQAVLSNFGSQPVRTTAHLEAGALRASRAAEIPAGGSVTVSFQGDVPPAADEWPIAVTLDNDAFPADDSAGVVVRAGSTLSCDAVTQDEAQLGFMMKALHAIPFLDVQAAAGLGRDKPDFIVWNRPEMADVEKIEALASGGSVVVVVPGFSGDAVAGRLMGAADAGRAEPDYERTGKGWSLTVAQPQDAAFSLFRGGEFASFLSDVRVFLRLKDGLADWYHLVDVPVRYEDGVPAIARRTKGRGAVILWNVPVQPRDATWGASPVFLPFLAEMMLSSRQEGVGERPPEPGRDTPSWILPAHLDAADLALFGPDGRELPCRESRLSSGERLLASLEPAVPGAYAWKRRNDSGAPLHTVWVNFPVQESDLESLTVDALPSAAAVVIPSGRLAEVTGVVLAWPWLLGMALLLFACELFLSSRSSAPLRGKESKHDI